MATKISNNIIIFAVRLFGKERYAGRKVMIMFLSAFFLFLCVAYFSLLIQTIFNVVEHQDIEAEIPKFNAELQQKKFEYISLRNDVDKEEAEKMGLVALEDDSVEYITRNSIGFQTEDGI
ncbi:MAG: hypothetical protein ACQEP6_02370 [Patescibacteria group bacterium]